jgi:hypothetical protein
LRKRGNRKRGNRNRKNEVVDPFAARGVMEDFLPENITVFTRTNHSFPALQRNDQKHVCASGIP